MSLSPDSVAIQLDLAVALQLAGDIAAAIRDILRSSAGNHPRHRRQIISLGYTRRHARRENRDGARAVKLAEHACRLKQNRNPLYMGTLGSAYAEAGRFEEAIDVTRRATQLAGQAGQDKLVDSLRQRLLLYQKERPFHQSPEGAKPRIAVTRVWKAKRCRKTYDGRPRPSIAVSCSRNSTDVDLLNMG